MNADERAELWQRRLFEAEAGMSRYLGERHGGHDIGRWHQIRQQIFDDLPDLRPPDPVGWQSVFFRAQALMERFLVGQYGHQELIEWARMNATVHQQVEPSPQKRPVDPIHRVARQAELYGSSFNVTQDDDESAEVEITHCAIWDYREEARRRGVAITLQSPCEYCVHATASNIRAKGYGVKYELTDEPGGPGCRWVATRRDPSGRD